MSETKGLPVNLDAERFVLGSIILDDTRFLEAASVLSSEDFSLEKHRRIFHRMKGMNERGDIIDRGTILIELQRHNELESCDGIGYLNSLDEGLPQVASIGSYVRTVQDKSTLRRIIFAAQQMATRAMTSSDHPAEILAGASETLLGLSGRTVGTSLLGPAAVIEREGGITQYLDRKTRGRGLSWGYQSLDTYTGGLEPGKMYVVGARPRMGKTAFAMNVADKATAAAESSKGVAAIFSLEMGDVSLLDRLVCSRAKVSLRKFAGGYLNRDEERAVAQAAGKVAAEDRIRIDDKAITDITEVHSKLRQLQARENVVLVVLDYLQLMLNGKEQYRVAEMSKISRNAKVMLKDCKVPGITLSQLSRGVDERTDHRPVLSDLRESGAIEQDADLVGFLYREDVYRSKEMPKDGLAEFIIAKQRDGPEGTVPMAFRGEYTSFEEIAQGGDWNESAER